MSRLPQIDSAQGLHAERRSIWAELDKSGAMRLVIALTAIFCLALARTSRAQENPAPTVGLAEMQHLAATTNVADWAHWGPSPDQYSSWGTHSNRLVPIYTFGGNLDAVAGEQSLYRDATKIRSLYGALPKETLNPSANYLDQTDVFRLQQQAVAAGKKRIVLFVFDGMDWQTTRAAAIAKTGTVSYREGRGTGLQFQDYANAETDFGEFVSSPHNNGTNVDVNKQQVSNPGGTMPGGYSPDRAGSHAWSTPKNREYIIGRDEQLKHAYTDSAASATSMTSGIKTYNNAINVDFSGREVLPIARTLQDQGFAVGAVSSVPFNHATPACAYANNVHRGDYQDIARDMLGLPSVFHPGGLPGLDVVIGAGWGEMKEKDGGQGENFVSGNRYVTAKDIKDSRAVNGGDYVVVTRKAGMSGSKVIRNAARRAKKQSKGLFGFFGVSGGHLPFQTADGDYVPVASIGNAKAAAPETYSPEDLSENPTLGDMAMAAIDVLSAKSDQWWLLVEAGDVDWANHANNLDNSIGAVLSGDDAFAKVMNWVDTNGGWKDTFVIVTADHGHYLVIDQPERLAGE
ncbi:MAG: alkaline phosphatase [Aureliella sp.]